MVWLRPLYGAIKDRDEWLARKAGSLGDAAEMRVVLEGWCRAAEATLTDEEMCVVLAARLRDGDSSPDPDCLRELARDDDAWADYALPP